MSKHKPPKRLTPFTRKISEQEIHNRLSAVMSHIEDYYFEGAARLARDADISRSALSRLMCGHSSPSFALVCALTNVLEAKLGRRIDPRDLVSLDGQYLTASICELTGCDGCLPELIHNHRNEVKPEYKHIRPGKWSLETSSHGQTLISIADKEAT